MNKQSNSQNLFNGNSKIFVNNLIFYLFLFIFSLLVIEVFWVNKFFHHYVFYEWLINYSQGFIRRGLSGTLLLFLQQEYKINIHRVIRYFGYVIFLFFSMLYLIKTQQSKKKLDWESLMVILFLPCLILFPLNDLAVIGRKEFLFFFGLLINLFFVSKTVKSLNISENIEFFEKNTINKYCYNLFLCYNLLSIPITLIHEGIIFLGLPLNIIITANLLSLIRSKREVGWKTIIIYLPTLLVCFFCISFKGNQEMARGICRSWQEYSKLYSNLSEDCSQYTPFIGALGYSLRNILKMVWSRNIAPYHGFSFLMWIWIFCLNTVILMRTSSKILTNSVENFKQKISEYYQSKLPNTVDIITSFTFKYAFIPFCCSFILYVAALDWGRWFFVTSISYCLCLLSPSLIQLEIINYHENKNNLKILHPIYLIYSKTIKRLHSQQLLTRFSIIYFPILIYTLFILRVPHAVINVKDLYSMPIFHRLFTLLS